jgi:hypothetical protein
VTAGHDAQCTGIDIHILERKPAIAAELWGDVPVIGILVIVADATGVVGKEVVLYSNLIGEELHLPTEQRGHGIDEILVLSEILEYFLVACRALDTDWDVGPVVPFKFFMRKNLEWPVAPVIIPVSHFEGACADCLANIGRDEIADEGVAFFPILVDVILGGHDSIAVVKDEQGL